MKLLAFSINGVQYLVNPDQIEKAGSLEKAAQKMAGIETKAEKVKVKAEGDKLDEK